MIESQIDPTVTEIAETLNGERTHSAALRKRRQAIARHPILQGLDYVNVQRDGDCHRLFVYFIPSTCAQGTKTAVPSDITPAKILISDYRDLNATPDLLISEVVYGKWERRIDSIIESVLSFDGETRINCGSRVDLANKSFSIEFWARRGAVEGEQIILGQGPAGSHLVLTIGFSGAGRFVFGFSGDDLEVDSAETDSDWHHWACVYDAAPRRQIVYRDGVKLGQRWAADHFRGCGPLFLGSGPEGSFFFSSPVSQAPEGTRVWNISRTQAVSDGLPSTVRGHFKGQLGEIRIWDKVLTEDDINSNMYHRLEGRQQRLLAYWNSSDQHGKLTDLSGCGNDGRCPVGISTAVEKPPSPPGYISRRQGSRLELYQEGDVLSITVREARRTAREREVTRFKLTFPDAVNLDPFFASVTFDLKSVSEFDPQYIPNLEHKLAKAPDIDYLTKDYRGFRRMMLDRMASLAPIWSDHNAADMGMALAETLAFAADQLSYFQDAVATEAYLGTARRRISVARHAQLIDYWMHNGCNARVFAHVQVHGDLELDRGTMLTTKVPGCGASVSPNTFADERPNADCSVFETMHRVVLHPENNSLPFYTWGGTRPVLRRGATRAALLGSFQRISAGDVLILQETKGIKTGLEEDANPSNRHAVRLKSVAISHDSLGGLDGKPVSITEIEWFREDALPFDLTLEAQFGKARLTGISVALGNIVLADHGATISDETLPGVSPGRKYNPRLERSNLTFSVPYDNNAALQCSADRTLTQNPRKTISDARLSELGSQEEWRTVSDFFGSDRFSRCFVVETESDQTAYLRFGNGKQGKLPTEGMRFRAVYRVGNGKGGNIGREAIAHVVTDRPGITLVRNPMSAIGGVDAEDMEEVRSRAPQALRSQRRCVTTADYAETAGSHPEVRKVAAEMRWTGSWYTAVVAVSRKGDLPADPAFCHELRTYVEQFRISGADVSVVPPRFVPLDIAMKVTVSSGYYPSSVEHLLYKKFSNEAFSDGTRGFFHPENFTFGQSIFLSTLISLAKTIPGVDDIRITRLQRWGRASEKELERGELSVATLEIVRLDNNIQAPGNGRMMFELVVPQRS